MPNPIDDLSWDEFNDQVTKLKNDNGTHPFTYQEWLTQEGITDAQVQTRLDNGS